MIPPAVPQGAEEREHEMATNALAARVLELDAAALGGNWWTGATPGYLMARQDEHKMGLPVTIRSDAHTEEIATVWTYLLPTEANADLIAEYRNAAPRLAREVLALRLRCNQQERNAKALREAVEIAVEDKYLCDDCKDGLRRALSLVEAEGEKT